MFGRTRTEKRVDPETGTVHARDRVVPREQWEVLIPEHHRGFITWETFEANTARLRGNWRRPRELAGGAVREGRTTTAGADMRRGVRRPHHHGANASNSSAR